MSFAPTDIERMRENEQQHREEKEKLKRLSLESDIARAQAVETEVQNRLRETEEDYKRQISTLQGDLARSKATEANGRSTIDNLAQQVHDLQDQLDQSKLMEARHAQLSEEHSSAKDELEMLKKERDKLDGKLKLAKHNLAQRKDYHRKVGILEQRIAWYFDQNSELETQRDDLKKQKDELQKENDATAAQLEDTEATLHQTTTQNVNLQATLKDVLDDATCRAETVKAAKAARARAETSLAQEKGERAKLEDEHEKLDGECGRLRTEVSLLLKEVDELTDLYEKSRAKKSRFRRK